MDEEKKTLLKKLHSACRNGTCKEVGSILKDEKISTVLNRRLGHDKKAALHIATENNQFECVELLLNHPNISVDVEDARKWTSLQMAANDGRAVIVELLLEHRADLWHHTDNENTPCHNAAMHGRSEVVEILLKSDAKLANVQNTHQWTPLHLACVAGYTDTVKILLKFNADPESLTYLGETPCNLAARDNCVDTIRVLRKAGANLDAPNQSGEAPLHTAAMSGHEDTTEYLLKHGVNAKAKTKTGMSALHFAAKNGHDKIVNIFRDYSSDFENLINEKTERGNTLWISTMGCGLHLPEMTPLHLAALEAKPETVKALIVCGADRTIKDGNDRTPLELVNCHMHKYQAWDRESVDEVKDTLEKWTVANENARSLANREPGQADAHYADSDYQSSCTTEDITESMNDLEGSVRSFPQNTSNSRKTRKGIERLRKEQCQIDALIKKSDSISEVEKGKLNAKLQQIENDIKSLLNLFENRKQERGVLDAAAVNELPEKKELIKKFRSNFTILQENLQAEDHMHFLFQEEVLESSDIEQIYGAPTETKKTLKLLYILWGKKSDAWIEVFLKSLEMCESSKHLVELFAE